LREKPKYAGRAIELVATIKGRIVGFLDIELEAWKVSRCEKIGGLEY